MNYSNLAKTHEDAATVKDTPVSKVLVLDDNKAHAGALKRFCDANNLVALKVRKDSVMSVLRTNVDLGGVFYSDTYGASPAETADIARQIHAVRPELPIFIRREKNATLTDLPEAFQKSLCAAYVAADMDGLRQLVDQYIFCLLYPNALLRGISEITESVLKSRGKGVEVSMATPYIVHDRVIFGELFSLIQLESAWCRGYMMLQTEEAGFLAAMDPAHAGDETGNFREVNDLLSEITNLIWGSFKNRYIGDVSLAAGSQVQVPLIVNHKRKYISFGSENPQLCFRFTLVNPATKSSTTLFARYVFNLSWSPEDFKEIILDADDMVDSGELELF